MQPVPPGFQRIDAGPVTLVVDAAHVGTAQALGLLEPSGVERLFAGRAPAAAGRAPVACVPLPAGGGEWMVRRLHHGGWLAPLLGDVFLGLGRPLRELAVTAALREAGAPVPRPAFAWGRHRAGPFASAAVATWREPDAADALAFLGTAPEPARLLAACAALGRAVRRFHDAGGRHGDLHVKNLLLRERNGRFEGIVIDLDKARVTPGLTPGERMAQLMRLFRSLRKRGVLARVGPRGCARFFRAYCGDDRALRRALWSRLDHELRKLALHAWRYRPADGTA